MKLTIRKIQDVTGGVLLNGRPETVIERLSIDSRSIGKNCLFVPIIGENADGHSYLKMAVENGAAAVLSSSEEAAGALKGTAPAILLVDDTVNALQSIGRAARERIRIPAVGVTGSVGKTTTREMIYTALSAGLRTYKTEKNYNNRLGVPITLSEIPEEAEIAVLELGLNVPGELGSIAALTGIDTAVITNIGVAHMEYYGDREGIAREKFTVTRGFRKDDPREKRLFLNGDDPYLRRHKEFTDYPVTFYGFQEENDYRAVNLHSENGNYVFDLYRSGRFLLSVSLSALGLHNVSNALAALAVSDHYGVDLVKAGEALARFTGFKGRLEKKYCRGALLIDDTYNASPASMLAGLDVLSEIRFDGGRKVAVLGDMLELGNEAERFHEEVGKALSSKPIDEVLLLGALAEGIGRGIKMNGGTMSVRSFQDPESLLAYIETSIAPGDVFYFKASRGMRFDRLTESLVPHE